MRELFKILDELLPIHETIVEVSFGNNNQKEESDDEREGEEVFGVLEVEEAEKESSISI